MSPDPLDSNPCRETTGFLFKHPCAYQADQTCQQCGKSICSRHVRMLDSYAVCISCSKQPGQPGGVRPARQPYNDRYDYAGRYYDGYGCYHSGYWGYWYLGQHGAHDRNDFTEADSQSLASEGDEAFEQDMGES